MEFPVGIEKGRDVGFRPVHRFGQNRVDSAQLGKAFVIHPLCGPFGGMRFEHCPQREHFVDFIIRPIRNRKPLGSAAYQQHLVFQSLDRIAYRCSRHAGNLGEPFLGQLHTRMRFSVKDEATDFFIGSVGSAAHVQAIGGITGVGQVQTRTGSFHLTECNCIQYNVPRENLTMPKPEAL